MPRKSVAPQPIARLVWVLPGANVTIDAPGPNTSAAQLMVEQLEKRKALKKLDVAAVAAVLSLALAVDSMPGDARLWAQYRQAMDALRALDRLTEEDDDWTAETAKLGAPEVRHTTQPGAAKPRPSGGRRKPASQSGADAAPAARVGRRPRAGT